MSMIGTGVGIYLGLKTVNGKTILELKKSKIAKTGWFCIILLYALGIVSIYGGIKSGNLSMIIAGLLILGGFSYLFMVSAIFQRSKNYVIDFVDLGNFRLYYKGREVVFDYRLDNEGKFLFLNDKKKHLCVGYKDGKRMGSTRRYKIVNYFSKWLQDNDMLSKQTTFSLE